MAQYVVFINPANLRWQNSIKNEIEKYKRVLDPNLHIEYRNECSIPVIRPDDNLIGVFFGSNRLPNPLPIKSKNAINQLLRNKKKIIPLFEKGSQFEKQIPPSLHGINGYRVDPTTFGWSPLAVIVLEALGYLRSKRKVFVSYVRRRSRGVALQLYSKLSEYWYDVFLDTHDILPGVNFQPELKHRLTDCDILVLLDTPEVISRPYVMEEINLANRIGLGGVRVVWPNSAGWMRGSKGTEAAEFCYPVFVEDCDFNHIDPNDHSLDTLTDNAIDRVIIAVEKNRAASQSARERKLVDGFCREAGSSATVSPSRYITYVSPSGKNHRIDTVIGHPDSVTMHQCLQAPRDPCSIIGLLYDPTEIAEHWVNHLHFLGSYLKVQLLPSTSVRDWLVGLP